MQSLLERIGCTEGLGGDFPTVLRFDECFAKAHGLCNTGEWGVRSACSRNDERAEVEQPAKQPLLNLDALNSVQVDLDCLPAHEAMLDDESFGRHCEFHRLVAHVGDDQEDEPD